MNDVEVMEVSSTAVTFKTEAGSIMLAEGVKTKPKIAMEMGYTTPAEYKKAVKKFYAIMRDQKKRFQDSIN